MKPRPGYDRGLTMVYRGSSADLRVSQDLDRLALGAVIELPVLMVATSCSIDLLSHVASHTCSDGSCIPGNVPINEAWLKARPPATARRRGCGEHQVTFWPPLSES